MLENTQLNTGLFPNPFVNLSQQRAGRLAGICYLALGILSGMSFTLIEGIVEEGNPSQTVSNLSDSEITFTIAIICGLFGQIFFLFTGLTLYELYKSVNRNAAH